jgi:hypothetical protein
LNCTENNQCIIRIASSNRKKKKSIALAQTHTHACKIIHHHLLSKDIVYENTPRLIVAGRVGGVERDRAYRACRRIVNVGWPVISNDTRIQNEILSIGNIEADVVVDKLTTNEPQWINQRNGTRDAKVTVM